MTHGSTARTHSQHLSLVPVVQGTVDQRILSKTHSAAALANPTTLPERIAARRVELGLDQGYIAERIHVRRIDTRTGKPKLVRLARNSYCHYERGTITPKVEVLAQIAKVLKTSIEWLLFGENKTTTIQRLEFDTKNKTFAATQDWSIDHAWLSERYGNEANQFVVTCLSQDTPHTTMGDMAIVRRDVLPSASSGEYVFIYKGTARAAKIVRPTASALLRVYSVQGDHYDEIPQAKVVVLGKIVGKIGLLN